MRPRFWFRALRAAVLAAAVGGFCTGILPGAEEFTTRAWMVEDGLPSNVVTDVAFDANGLMWVGTTSGLAWFDGRQFSEIPPPPLANVPVYSTRAIAVQGGTPMILPSTGGLAWVRDGRFVMHPASEALANATLVDLFAEPDGTLWVGTGTSGVARIGTAGRIEWFGTADGVVRRNKRYSFAQDAAGRTWVASNTFLGYYADGKLIGRNVGGTGVIVAPARDGGIWISTTERLLKINGDRLSVILDQTRWPATENSGVQILFESSSGELWIGTRRGGLFVLRGDTADRVPVGYNLINSIAEDTDRNIWVCTNGGGLTRVRAKAFTMVDVSAGLPDDISSAVCEDASGALWCANRSGGLIRFENGIVTRTAPAPGRPTTYANCVYPDNKGYIWVGAGDGLFRVAISDPRQLETVTRDVRSVHVLLCARDGAMWVGYGDEGDIVVFRNGVMERMTLPGSVPAKRIQAITEDKRGRIWISTSNHQLYLWERGAVKELPTDGIPGGPILAIYCDDEENVWLGTLGGLVLIKGDSRTVFTTHDGLPDSQVLQIQEDDQHRFWFGTRVGLVCVSRTRLLAEAANQNRSLHAAVFGPEAGLRGTSALQDSQPMSWRGANGRLWFATHGGVLGIDPSRIAPERPSPPVFIRSVNIDRNPVLAKDPLRVPANSHEVQFAMLALDYTTPDSLRLRHQLVGSDFGWVDTPPDHNATYSRLSPGSYEFRVIASSATGPWSAAPVTLRVVILPAWWQTWWFRLAAVVAFTAAVGGCARYWSHRRLKARVHRLEREHALDRERARIARNLHDDLGGTVTRIGLLAERVKRHSTDPLVQTSSAQLAVSTRRLASELESIVWTVSPRNNTWDRLAAFAARYARRLCEDSDLPCSVSGMETIPSQAVAPEVQHHVLAVLKEALNNVLKHSRASAVSILMSVEDGCFLLRVEDDGVGFDPTAPEHAERNGLSNMRTRINDIGGQITIISKPGSGAAVTIRQPLSIHPKPTREA